MSPEAAMSWMCSLVYQSLNAASVRSGWFGADFTISRPGVAALTIAAALSSVSSI